MPAFIGPRLRNGRTRTNRKRVQKVEIVSKPKRSGYGKIQRMPFKQHMIVKLKYATNLNVASALGVYSENQFRLNSIFDPDLTNVGHQPYMYDTYATMYNKYRVLKVAYKFTGQLNTAAISAMTILPNNNTSSSVGNVDLAIESPYGKFKVLSGPGAEAETLTGTIDLATFTGRTKAQYSADDLYESQIGTSPAEVMVLHIGIAGLTATSVSLLGVLELFYTVELFDPVQLSQS